MAERLEEIQIQFQKRNARKRGPTSSDQFNDTIEEIAHDFAEFNTQWNDLLVPLTAKLPDGTEGLSVNAIDAFVNGLDGKTLFTDSRSTSTLNTSYYNTSAQRPMTVWEQFDNVYTTVTLLQENLENQISNNILTASQISIVDDTGLYSSVNVEDALEEVMVKANIAVAATALDLSAISQHIIPSLDDLYDIGSTSLRWRDLYLGPASLNIVAKSTDFGQVANRDYHIGVEGSSSKLEFKQTGTSLLLLDSTLLSTTVDINTPTVQLQELAASPTASAGAGKLFSKTDQQLYFIDSLGVERNVLLGAETLSNILALSADTDNNEANSAITFNIDGTEHWRLNTNGSLTSVSGSAILEGDGSATAPSYSFSADATTGMYRAAGGIIRFSTNGVNRWQIASTGALQGLSQSALLYPESGSAAFPAHAFVTDGTTGMYRAAASTIGFSTGGTAKWTMNSTGDFVAQLGTAKVYSGTSGGAALPNFSFGGGSDTGMYWAGPKELGFSTTALERMRISATGLMGINQSTPLVKLHVTDTPVAAYTSALTDIVAVFERDLDSYIDIVTGTSKISGIRFSDTGSTTSGKFEYSHGFDRFGWWVQGAPRMKMLLGELSPWSAGFDLGSTTVPWENVYANNVGIGLTAAPLARLHVSPGNSATTLFAGRNIALGAHLVSSSGRTGFSVTGSNSFLGVSDDAAFNYFHPFDATNALATYKVFRIATGTEVGAVDNPAVTMTDRFWVQKDGGAYFGGNVGIGKPTPAVSLDMAGGIRAGSGAPGANGVNNNGYAFDGDSDSGMFSLVDGKLSFFVDSLEHMTVTTLGQVGIGTASPTYKLHIRAAIADGIFIEDNNVSNVSPMLRIRGQRSDTASNMPFAGRVVLERFSSGGAVTTSNPLGSIYFGGNHTSGSSANIAYGAAIVGRAGGAFNNINDMPSELAFHTGSVGEPDLTSNLTVGTERMRINAAGFVGISTNNPVVPLHVVGNIANYNPGLANLGSIAVRASDFGTSFRASELRYRGATFVGDVIAGIPGANTGELMFQNTTHGLIGTNGSGSLVLYTATTERMRIDGTTGFVGIGANAPGRLLEVQGIGVPTELNSTDSNAAKLQLSDNGTTRGFLGATATNSFSVIDSTQTNTHFAVNNTTGDIVSPSMQQFASVTYTVGSSPSSGSVTAFNTTTVGGAVATNTSSGITYNSSTGQFSISKTGIYKININLGINHSVGGDVYTSVLFANGATVLLLRQQSTISLQSYSALISDVIVNLTAGDLLTFTISGGALLYSILEGSTFNITRIA